MCGIAGYFCPQAAIVDRGTMKSTVRAMIGTMIHRGPDAEGIWSDPSGRCVLGHRRLSIIDISDAGRQPMLSNDGRYVITFNGEIYNYLEMRPLLEAAGIRIRGRTDTEILLEALALWGTSALERLDGMFAFAVFDTLSGELLLARDPFGEKPLYYTQLSNGAVGFASELQALERMPSFDSRIGVEAVAEMLAFQYVGAPRSIYTSVKKLAPGHWLRITKNGSIYTERYFQFRPGLSGFSERPMADLTDELEDILLRSMRRRMVADVPLGAFLSGGVDSSTVCALVRKRLRLPLKTFSIGFAGAPDSEHLIARAFAEHLGTDHYEEVLSPESSDFLAGIGAVIDEPNGDSSCLPTYLLSRFARRQVTVAISGDGGDELFGGYDRYFATLQELALHNSEGRSESSPGTAYYSNRILVSVERHIEELLGFVPASLIERLQVLRNELDAAGSQLLCAMRKTDAENYLPGAVLPKVDRMSMRHSLEVRTPYLNVELARFAERLPDSVLASPGRGKLVLREVAYRYLPQQLVDLPKKGFGLPLSDWGRQSLLGVAERLLEKDDSRLKVALGPEGIARFLRRQRSPGQFSAYQVWGAVVLESWLRHHPAELSNLTDEVRFCQKARRRADAEQRQISLEAELALLRGQLSEAEAKYTRALEERDQLLSSTSWRLTEPVRLVARAAPPGLRRQARRAGKLAYWFLTPHRMRQRMMYLQSRRRGLLSVASPGNRPPVQYYGERLAAKVYAVARVPLQLKSMPSELLPCALELLRSAGSDGDLSTGELFRFPDFAHPFPTTPVGEIPPDLRGATLLFTEKEAVYDFGYNAYQTITRLGVARAVFLNPSLGDELIDFEFRAQSGRLHRILNIAALFRQRAARLSSHRVHRCFGARLFVIAADGLYHSLKLPEIDSSLSKELSTRYALFEDGKQLPPGETPLSVIAERRNGRYQVWNQEVVFAPTAEAKRNSCFWLVPVNEKTKGNLPIFAQKYKPLRASYEREKELFQALLENSHAPAFDLSPGDTIALCTHTLSPGGAERQWVYLATALRDLGYQIVFVVYETLDGEHSHYLPALRQAGIPVVDSLSLSLGQKMALWPKTMPADLLELPTVPEGKHLLSLTSAFIAARPKIVFAQLDHPNILAGLAAHIAGVPRVVISFRNYNPTNFNLHKEWFLRAYRELARSRRVIMTGNHRGANDDYARWIGVPSERVAHIANAIDPEAFPTPTPTQLIEAREELGILPGSQVILGVFRLAPEKDPLAFVEVCARAILAEPHARAFIVGLGPMREEVKERIEALQLADRIFLLGQRHDVNVLLKLAAVFLLTSQLEGMPNVVLEAQLMGTPVVATDAGGTRDAVVDGRTALLHPVGDIDALVTSVTMLLRDPSRARIMGKAGRAHVLSAFSKRRLAERYLDAVCGSTAEVTFPEVIP